MQLIDPWGSGSSQLAVELLLPWLWVGDKEELKTSTEEKWINMYKKRQNEYDIIKLDVFLGRDKNSVTTNE